jgi:orotidine-5'-phosphate decarboxylase
MRTDGDPTREQARWGDAGRPPRARVLGETRPVLPANPLVVALDVPDLRLAEEFATVLSGRVGFLKVGLELFGAAGPAAVEAIGAHAPVFLDLKLHDIPTTVARAAHRLGAMGVSMTTVHAVGGREMVEAAAEGLAAGAAEVRAPTPILLAVTVLTSMSDRDLADVNQPSATEQVPALARLATAAGATGLVCAPRDLARVRDAVGDEPVLATPGIRPAGADIADHVRAATPEAALASGADLLVVGRPVTDAPDPARAADDLIAGLGAAAGGPSSR